VPGADHTDTSQRSSLLCLNDSGSSICSRDG